MLLPAKTLQVIADQAGVSKTSVSRALANRPGVSAALRQKILKISQELDYRPNPLISSLMISLRSQRSPLPSHKGAILAYVQRADRPADANKDHFAGAFAAAREQGYLLEPFIVGQAGYTPARLNSILIARGVYGVLIAPLPEGHGSFELAWPRFCTVVIEYTFNHPAFDRVVHDAYASMRLVLEKCRGRGLRRIGLIFTENSHERTEGLNEAAYLMEQKISGLFASIPPLNTDPTNHTRIASWFDRHRPEVIILSNRHLVAVHAFLGKRGLRIPEDCSMININRLQAHRESLISGIDQNNDAIGATAVRLLIDKINRNDPGIPPVAHTVQTPGRWVDEKTLRSPVEASAR